MYVIIGKSVCLAGGRPCLVGTVDFFPEFVGWLRKGSFGPIEFGTREEAENFLKLLNREGKAYGLSRPAEVVERASVRDYDGEWMA